MGSHKAWRKIVKKERRRKIRISKAKRLSADREAEQSAKLKDPNYQRWLEEQEKLENFKILETEKIRQKEHEKWLRTEEIAQHQWRQLREKLAEARLEKTRKDALIKKEWEERQNKIQEAERARKSKEDEEVRRHKEMTEKIERFIEGEGPLPEEFLEIKETNPDKEICPFYSKIGVCRFGDSCSRNHRKPGVSKVLLVRNFYSHFGIEHSNPDEYDTDILLEYDDKDTYDHFKEFFNDVFPEFDKIGRIVQFKVCCNFERHLRGNTYVEYSTLSEAVKAYRIFHGRWYGGKQISLQFCDIPSWKQAICGLFASNRCPKGRACNFLHVFRNPNGEFYEKEKKHHNGFYQNNIKSQTRDIKSRSNWRWSESLEPSTIYNKRSLRKLDESYRELRERCKRSPKHRKRSKSPSRHSREKNTKRKKTEKSLRQK